jgi:ABC-2 type transport system permease protein
MKDPTLFSEARKLPAFFRRDLLTALSYRTAFVLDWGNLLVQLFLFSLIGRLVDPNTLAGTGSSSYVEFTAVGIALSGFMQLALTRATASIREEQLMGTLESVLLTPTSPITFTLGSVAYNVVYVPVRTLLFLVLASWLFGLGFSFVGILGVLLVLIAFIPFVWGLGMIGAGVALTVRRGNVIAGLVGLGLTVGSNTYFPIEVLPGWLKPIARANPLTISLDAARRVLGGEGWQAVWEAIRPLLSPAVVALILGVVSLRIALAHERAKGTLGQY